MRLEKCWEGCVKEQEKMLPSTASMTQVYIPNRIIFCCSNTPDYFFSETFNIILES